MDDLYYHEGWKCLMRRVDGQLVVVHDYTTDGLVMADGWEVCTAITPPRPITDHERLQLCLGGGAEVFLD